MKKGRASQTAVKVAIRRAAHQLVDQPPVLDDPIAVALVGDGYARDMERAMHSVARDFRAFMSARSRCLEDRLAEAIGKGILQYVLIGAGLDTFAYRNPHRGLQVFEVDFPATQELKQSMLAEAGIEAPENVHYVALDLEHKTLGDSLREAGVRPDLPVFFGWLGVVPYLTAAACRATLRAMAEWPQGTEVGLDYAFPPETLSPARRRVFDTLAGRVAAAGEPFRLFFTPDQMEQELHAAGFNHVEQVGTARLNAMYFDGRADGLKLSTNELGTLAFARKSGAQPQGVRG